MAGLSYKGRFVEYVENGLKPKPKKGDRIKRQTVRNFRKNPIKAGETLYHYYGMRTKHCKKLGESICVSVNRITIRKTSITIYDPTALPHLRHERLTSKQHLDDFAYADGFTDWEEMRKWWLISHGPECFPFIGQLIKW
jgi:hypothetical protein